MHNTYRRCCLPKLPSGGVGTADKGDLGVGLPTDVIPWQLDPGGTDAPAGGSNNEDIIPEGYGTEFWGLAEVSVKFRRQR
jgi:hypothetical protein